MAAPAIGYPNPMSMIVDTPYYSPFYSPDQFGCEVPQSSPSSGADDMMMDIGDFDFLDSIDPSKDADSDRLSAENAGGRHENCDSNIVKKECQTQSQTITQTPKRKRRQTDRPTRGVSPEKNGSLRRSRNRAPIKPSQRNAANARERSRMRVLSKAFTRLKTSLPWVPADTKLSKLDTLRLAACYIGHLQGVLENEQDNGSIHPLSLTWPFISGVRAIGSSVTSPRGEGMT